MSGLAPPPPFLPTPGRPAVPWPQWLRIFENFLLASGASDCTPDRRKALLLHSLGVEGQRIFYTLPLPSSDNAKPGEQTAIDKIPAASKGIADTRTEASSYDIAVAALHTHFITASNVVAERHRFGRRVQQASETINEYVTALRELSDTCSFPSVEDSLRDQFVAGVSSLSLRERFLLEGSSLSFARAVVMATQFEQVTNDLQEFTPANVERITARGNTPTHSPHSDDSSKPSRYHQTRCYRCGASQHNAASSRCPAKNKRCHHCGITGHFRSVCNKRYVAPVREVESDNPSNEEVLSILAVTTSARLAIHVTVLIGRTDITFLVDSGSSVSILTHALFRQHFEGQALSTPRVRLLDYSKRPITVLGCFFADVTHKDCTKCLLFYVVKQGTSLLGVDAIKALGLQIDGSTLRCLETTTLPTNVGEEQSSDKKEVQQPVQLPTELAQEYGTIFDPGLGLAKGFVHRVKTRSTVQPVASKLRRLPLSLRPVVSEELRRLEEMDVIERVEASEWVSPIVVVKKKEGGIRLCVDLRQANKAVVADSFPLPHTEELLHSLVGATHFSKLDLASAYHQVLLHPESRDLTAFVTHDGLFRFKRVCFGLASAPSAFQSMMSKILQGCSGVLFYIDDIIVFGKSRKEHMVNLAAVLRRIKEAGLKLNRKCVFDTQELVFLGHRVTANGIVPLKEKVASIQDTPAPTDAAGLRSFLGLVEYYARFIPNFADIVEPMRVLLRKGQLFEWSGEVEASFRMVKDALASSTILRMFDASLPVVVSTDASDCGLGAVLQQREGQELHTVAFASRALSPAERKYSVGEREALACVWACERWHVYLWGRHFTLMTDHQALVTLLTTQGPGRRPLRVARWAERLLRYNYTVKYRKGSKNQVADALSRLPAASSQEEPLLDEVVSVVQIPACITREQFEQAQSNDRTLQQTKACIQSSWPAHKSLPDELRPFFKIRDELSVVDNLILRDERLVVPTSLTSQVIAAAHEAHPGVVRTKARLREKYWWPAMDREVELSIQRCSICQTADKSTKVTPAPLQPVPFPDQPWLKLAIDIVGPFERAPHDCRYAITLVDYYSKWPEVHFCSDTTTRTVTSFLVSVFAREGYPEEIVCDNGPQFSSREFEAFLEDRGIHLRHSSVYYPQANGQVERFNRVLKSFVQVATLEQRPLRQAVTEYLGVYRCTPHATTGSAPALLLHRRLPRTRLDVIGHPSAAFSADPGSELHHLRERVKQKQQYSKRYTDARRAARGTTVEVGDFVRVKKPKMAFKGDLEFSGPRKVISKKGPSSFRLDDGKTWNASKLSKVPRASAALHTWGERNGTAGESRAPPVSEELVPEATTSLSSAAAAAGTSTTATEQPSRPPVTFSASEHSLVTSGSPKASEPPRRVQPPRNRRPPDRYGYQV